MGRTTPSGTRLATARNTNRSSKRRQDETPGAIQERITYHHGDLRAALIKAADDLISQKGIEGFSLRAAAQKAGVSPAAPAHHFGGARGLLTEVAILAYERAGRYIDSAEQLQDVVADVRGVGLSFIRFAVDYPGHFRLMFRNDLVDRSDPRLATASKGPGNRLAQAVLSFRSQSNSSSGSFGEAAEMLCGIAALHGLANLILEEKAFHFFKGATSGNFVDEYLPQVIEHLYPRVVTDRSRETPL